jgi:hypothetical protein
MLKLIPIDRRTGLTRDEFIENYLKPRKPVVFTDLSKNWAAVHKWTFEYLTENFGDLDVPIVDPNYHKPGADYMKSKLTMKFGEYLKTIQKGPSKLRIFLWNIMEHANGLAGDVSLPTICDGWADKYPFMFFGGAGAVTGMHYDIDCSHVFHTHFLTRKHIVLFSPEQGPFLYQHPFTVQSPVNPLQPDYEKYPALENLTGYETILTHGETLFIPALWWHYIVYMDAGFSLSQRSIDNPLTMTRGLFNIARHFVVDKGMNALAGPGWKDWKEKESYKRAEKARASQ